MISQVIFIALLIFGLAYTQHPCGRCMGNFDSCEHEPCADNLKCVSLQSYLAKVCLPTVEHGQPCNDTKLYDPCEIGFVCDRPTTGKCVPITNYADIGDGCLNDDYCRTGLTCYNGACKLSAGSCTANYHCLWNQYCDTSLGGGCRSLSGSGESCSLVPCRYGTSCLRESDTSVNFKCVDDFSIAEGSRCTMNIQCKSGFVCDIETSTCSKPKYAKLITPGAIWGEACDINHDTGCRCHYGLHTYLYLKEESTVYKDFCGARKKEFDNCMTQKQCSSRNTGADTCYRKNCIHLDRALDECVSDPSRVPLRCGSNALFVAMLLLVFVLFI